MKAPEAHIFMISFAASIRRRCFTYSMGGMPSFSWIAEFCSYAEESAAASEKLTGQAQLLKGLVGQFKLLDSDGQAAVTPVRKEPAVSFESADPGHSRSSASKY